MLRPTLETEWERRWRLVANYCCGQEQRGWNFVGHQAVLLGAVGLGLGWWAERLYSLDLAELVEAREGRGVEIELKRARLTGKIFGVGNIGLC